MRMTLRTFLSEDLLQKLAGQKVFSRGELYCEERSVNLLSHTLHTATAEVQGSFPYRVKLELVDNRKLEAECTCPAMQDYGFCKHAVATGLYLIHHAYDTTHQNPPKQSKKDLFAEHYSNLAIWAKDGVIEIGRDGYSTSTIRLVDEGGTLYEGGTRHTSIHDMLIEADAFIEKWFKEHT